MSLARWQMQIAELLSGEWMLRGRSNGGVVIFLRALFIATEIYVAGLIVAWLINPDSGLCFNALSARRRIYETTHWFGAILGAVYAWLYARFSSQWQYLADLYNRILEVQVVSKERDEDALNGWFAAFIEDAYTLHLACKPMFATAINDLLKDERVREKYLDCTFRGEAHLADLRDRFRKRGMEPF